jgi:hypothetical protein
VSDAEEKMSHRAAGFDSYGFCAVCQSHRSPHGHMADCSVLKRIIDTAYPKERIEELEARNAKLEAVALLVREFSEGKLDYGDITAPTARTAALEQMFMVMRQKARDAIRLLDSASPSEGG